LHSKVNLNLRKKLVKWEDNCADTAESRSQAP
jgi:hypothetical protein